MAHRLATFFGFLVAIYAKLHAPNPSPRTKPRAQTHRTRHANSSAPEPSTAATDRRRTGPPPSPGGTDSVPSSSGVSVRGGSTCRFQMVVLDSSEDGQGGNAHPTALPGKPRKARAVQMLKRCWKMPAPMLLGPGLFSGITADEISGRFRISEWWLECCLVPH